MFNPLKAGKNAKMIMEVMKIQKELEKIESYAENGRATVTAAGGIIPKIKSIKINGEEMKDVLEAVNKALEEAQKKTANKMKDMKELQGMMGQ